MAVWRGNKYWHFVVLLRAIWKWMAWPMASRWRLFSTCRGLGFDSGWRAVLTSELKKYIKVMLGDVETDMNSILRHPPQAVGGPQWRLDTLRPYADGDPCQPCGRRGGRAYGAGFIESDIKPKRNLGVLISVSTVACAFSYSCLCWFPAFPCIGLCYFGSCVFWFCSPVHAGGSRRVMCG